MPMPRLCLLFPALLAAAAAPVDAATFTVTKTANTSDGVCDVADCSLSEAIVAANANAGADTVAFAIPGGGAKTIATGTNGFPAITDTLTIDGTTQPGWAANTQTGASNDAVIVIDLDGSLMNVGNDSVLDVAAPNSVVRGVSVRGHKATQFGVSFLVGSDGSALRGSFVGTNAAGTLDLSSGTGVAVRSANVTIGGTTAANRNVVAGNNVSGILVAASLAVGTQIQGNLVGIGANGAALGTSADGVVVSGLANGATIGGTATGARNFIANHTDDGVSVGPLAQGVRILGNLIFDNGDQAIDLGEDGFTRNDVDDLDSGANALQNFPALLSASFTEEANTVLGFSVVRVTGFLESTPSTSFRIELFEGGSSQEAEALVDAQDFTTDARGFATIRFETKGEIALGRALSATATNNVTNETSELSFAFGVSNGLEVNKTDDTNDGTCDTDCSLREAMVASNTLAGADTIVFAIEGGLPATIIPLTELPTITTPVQINGYSQPGTRYNSAPRGSNAIIGIEITGKALDPGATGLRFTTNTGNSSVRGLAITGYAGGAAIVVDDSFNTFGIRIGGNFLGPDASGLAGTEQGSGVVVAVEAQGLVIGDDSAIAPASPTQRNLISGNSGNGALVKGGTFAAIRGNAFGVAADGSAFGNGANGLLLTSTTFLPVGGSTARDANEIAHNGGAGVRMEANGTTSTITGNVFHDNVGLAIDLGAATGVTPNDAGDGDDGPNGLQNFPVLNLAAASNGITTVGGTLNSVASRNYRVDFYASPDCDPSGNGEGAQFLGALTTNTGADGNATVSGQISAVPLLGYDQLTAIATSFTTLQTSEFSACLPLPYSDPLFASSFE